jgi:hypothetical protein
MAIAVQMHPKHTIWAVENGCKVGTLSLTLSLGRIQQAILP